jgi:hypothetical protein
MSPFGSGRTSRNPVAAGECRMASPCLYCSSGIGHAPMIAVYDATEGEYRLHGEEEEREICIARRQSSGAGWAEGSICGSPATDWAGDIPLCQSHYKRLKTWAAAEDDLALERDARFHEQRLRQAEELSQQAMRLQLERIAAYAEAQAARSVVYYLRRVADGMIKIGFSGSVDDRLGTHKRQQGPIQVLLVLGGGRGEENAAHGEFWQYRIGRTEWFYPVRPLLEWICQARERHTHPEVQPDDIVPMGDLAELALAAVPLERLRFDDHTKRVIWPPDEAAAA